MNKVWSRVFGLALAAAAVGGAVMTTSGEAAADNACVPDVEIVNGTDQTIKVTKILYRVANSGGFYTEDLANHNLGKGDRRTWKSQKLSKTDIGDNLDFKVMYEVGNYNKFTTAEINTSGTCSNQRKYTLTAR